jgi:hypothetical protein
MKSNTPKKHRRKSTGKKNTGSVLILVIALLVLLALIGTAFLSTTQTERYASDQNSINTEADLLITGLQDVATSNISTALFANGQYRPPKQEMPTWTNDTTAVASTSVSAPSPGTYFNYNSPLADLFMGDRLPSNGAVPPASLPQTSFVPYWNSISWPMFPDGSGNYFFDSPFATSAALNLAQNKPNVQAYPMSVTLNGQLYPAMAFFIPLTLTGNSTYKVTVQTSTGPQTYTSQSQYQGVYITPNGFAAGSSPGYLFSNNQAIPSQYANFAASTSGDGIADAGMFKLPVGPINGVTYYGSWRVIDNNSAVNVSTAWTATADPMVGVVSDAQIVQNATNRVYGFFRSNIGLREMLQNTSEMDALNAYRFNGLLPGSGGLPSINNQPMQDETSTTVTARTDFSWMNSGDAVEHQLISRWANPGYNSSTQKFNFLGVSQSAALAYKFSLKNANAGESLIEQMLPAETYNHPALQSTPFAPSQAATWYSSLFNFDNGVMPLRTVLTGSNEVSNSIPSRLGYTASPATWNSTTTYDFGDWVIGPDNFSYVCLLHNAGQTPQQPKFGYTGVGPEYWTPVPWTRQPVKTSINTATFDQLWLGFAQAMTDSITPIGANNTIPLWQPPMMTPSQGVNYSEKQLQQFRSVIRDNRSLPVSNFTPPNTGNPKTMTASPRLQLTPTQMLQLRAALAAINTLDMRTAPADMTTRQVRSHQITLADNQGNPAYTVEVYATDVQPYIGQVYVQSKDDPNGAPGNGSENFIAIQLLNPYPVPINVTPNWGFATLTRTNYQTTTPPLTLASIGTVTSFTIPAATANGPGVYTIYDGNKPTKFAPTTSIQEPGLLTAIGKELVILKPRKLDGTLSSQTSPGDYFNEGVSGQPNLFHLVPVDQIDLTGTDQYANPGYYIYKRGSDPNVKGVNNGTFAWNFTWPGFYTPYNNKAASSSSTTVIPSYAPATQLNTLYHFSQAIVQLTAAPDFGSINFDSLTGGPADTSGAVATAPTYNTITMQLNNVGFPGPNPVAATNNQFPFGGFARNIDILQVPYIGAYRIGAYDPTGTQYPSSFYEINSVTMDSSLANDQTLQPNAALGASYTTVYPAGGGKILPTASGYTTAAPVANISGDSISDPFTEQIGRFCPVGDPYGSTPAAQMDFGPGYDSTGNSAFKNYWHYHWARRVLDYFAVQAPHDDYFPNADPALVDTSATPNIPAKYIPAQTNTANAPQPVNNTATIAPGTPGYYANALVAAKSEDSNNAGVEGLININTAPWPVLATLPFVPRGTDYLGYDNVNGLTPTTWPTPPTAPTPAPNGIDDNVDLAKAIVAYRNQNGPFKSIMDLYKVPAFRLESMMLLINGDPSSANGLGDFSGGPTSTTSAPTPDGVRFDFEERFLLLNNVSNLITTRSDSFTVYLLLQGWRNAGTGNPTLAVQRRAAFFVDRNPITPATPTLTAAPQTIPSD